MGTHRLPDEQELIRAAGAFPRGGFGLLATLPGSTEVVVAWSALPCQLEPAARVSRSDGGLHIEVTPGPNPVEHGAAMSIGYGFRMAPTQADDPLVITARLIDPVNHQFKDFPPVVP